MTRLHRIDSVLFVPGTNDGSLHCDCGWVGLASCFWRHRQSMGLKVANPSHHYKSEAFPGIFARKGPDRPRPTRPERAPRPRRVMANVDPTRVDIRCASGHLGRWRIRPGTNSYDCLDCKAEWQRLHRIEIREGVARKRTSVAACPHWVVYAWPMSSPTTSSGSSLRWDVLMRPLAPSPTSSGSSRPPSSTPSERSS